MLEGLTRIYSLTVSPVVPIGTGGRVSCLTLLIRTSAMSGVSRVVPQTLPV